MDVVIDIDQTLFPLLRSMQEVPGGEAVRESCSDWHGLADMCSRPLHEVISLAIQPEQASRIGLYPYAKETVLLLQEEGFSVSLATHRHEKHRPATELFLEEMGLHHLPLWVGEDVSKTDLLSERGILVDDAPHLLRQAHQDSRQATSLLHAYNKQTLQDLRFPHASHWQELQKIIFRSLRA